MIYKHVLVAVDLSESSDVVIRKAISIAKMSEAKVSFIFVDIATPVGNIDLNFSEYEFSMFNVQPKLSEEHKQKLQNLADSCGFPIANCIYLIGDLSKTLQLEIDELDIDLLICGHHHHFWGSLLSSTRKIVSEAKIDLLLVHL